MTRRSPGHWAALAFSLMAGMVWIIGRDEGSGAPAGIKPVEARPHRPLPMQPAVKKDSADGEGRLDMKALRDAASRFLADRVEAVR